MVIYRLAIAASIYILVNSLPLGPSVGGIAVSVSGAIIQLLSIVIMNKLYTSLARQLTNWGKSNLIYMALQKHICL